MKKIAGYYSEIEEYDGFYFRYNYKRQELEALDESGHVLTYKELSLEDWEDNNEYWIETFADELSEEAGRWTDSLLEEFGCLEKKKIKKANSQEDIDNFVANAEFFNKGILLKIDSLKSLVFPNDKKFEQDEYYTSKIDKLKKEVEELEAVAQKVKTTLGDIKTTKNLKKDNFI